jgi:MYXO-CTERM domain-containing protein
LAPSRAAAPSSAPRAVPHGLAMTAYRLDKGVSHVRFTLVAWSGVACLAACGATEEAPKARAASAVEPQQVPAEAAPRADDTPSDKPPELGRVKPGPRGCACALEAAPAPTGAGQAVLAALGLGLMRRRARRR